MKQTLLEWVGIAIAAIIGWFSSKAMTRREKRKDDLKLVTETMQPLLDCIKQMNEQYAILNDSYTKQQSTILSYMQENITLKGEIQDLKLSIDALRKEIATLKHRQ
jgi:uncharacterized protein YlxW (UPF0749 family)